MIGQLKQAALAATFVTLAPMASLVTGTVSDAQAHTYVSGSVSIGGPVAVLGFSYGNPFLYGRVYDSPELCDVGPVYYYPTYRVYAPYYPAYRYYSYSRPRYYYPQHHYYGYNGAPRYIRGHAGYGYYGANRGSHSRYQYRGHGGHGHDGRTIHR